MSLTDFLLGNNSWYEADCIEITLPNGSVLRATSHQNDLVVGGDIYYATTNGKWERGGTTQERNAVNEMELTLQCDENILFPNSVSTPMFQRAKLFARSTVKVTVAYMDLSEIIQGTQVVFNGVVTIPSIESARVTFKCSDFGYLLQAPWPRRVICAGCPFTVFDANCTLDKADFVVSKTVSAVSGTSGQVLTVSTISALGNDSLPMTKGYVVPSSGEAQGWHIGIEEHIDATHVRLAPFPILIAASDTVDMYPGCTGTMDACQNKFSNQGHFGGFRFVPKPEGALTGG